MNFMTHPHVELLQGKAFVRGSRVRVTRLWWWHRKGVATETLVKRYPSLGWARVLDALSWAYDNQEYIERELIDEQSLVDEKTSLTMEQLKLRGVT